MNLVYTLPVFDDAAGTATGAPFGVCIESRTIPLADSFDQAELGQGVSAPLMQYPQSPLTALASQLTFTVVGHLFRLHQCLVAPVSEVAEKQGGWASAHDVVWVWVRES